MNATDRRMIRISDMLAVIGERPAGSWGFGCTDRRPLLAATLRHYDTLTDLGLRPRTGEVVDPSRLPIKSCTDCGVEIQAWMTDGFGVRSPQSFPRCSQHAF